MVDIGSVDQLIDFFVADVFSEFLSDRPEVLGRDEAGPFVVIKGEDLVDVFPGVFVVDSAGEEVEPLSEVNGSAAVGVEVRDHLEDGCAFGFEAQGGHGGFELWVGQGLPLMSMDPP